VFSSPYFSRLQLLEPNTFSTNFALTNALSTFNGGFVIFFLTSLPFHSSTSEFPFSPPPLAYTFFVSIQGSDFSSSVCISPMLLALVVTTSSTSSMVELLWVELHNKDQWKESSVVRIGFKSTNRDHPRSGGIEISA
jgi:hypothetical protein